MAPRSRLYDKFGPFLLFKRLETDSLGELWRAGRVDGDRISEVVALRKLTGGNRSAIATTAEAAAHALPLITGTYIVKGQTAGVVGGEPFVAWNYASGRTLRHVIDRARDTAASPAPLPLDQAIVIAEKIAQSLVAVAEFRDTSGQRLTHGAAIPQFVWISDEGEIRMAGQLFGSALAASLRDGSIPSVARYFAPELRNSGVPSPLSEVYALGALLFLLVTGEEPPDALSSSAFANAVVGARTMTGQPVPDDIRSILRRTLTLDPSTRMGSVGDVKQAVSALSQSGKYSATTFNLAFYLSTALSKEMELESAEREKEAAVDVQEVLAAAATAAAVERPRQAPAAPVAAATPSPTAPIHQPGPLSTPQQTKSKAPMAIAAVVAVAAVGAGVFYMMQKPSAQAAQPVVQTASVIPVKKAAEIPQPVVSTPVGSAVTDSAATTTALPAGSADAAQKKAFEDAVAARLQAEMMKLQQQFTQGLKQQQSKNAPVATETQAAATQPREETTMSAAALDAQQREVARSQPAPAAQTVVPPVSTASPEPAPVETASTPAPAAPVAVREGDVVDMAELDQVPRPSRAIRPVYPLVAARQRIEATIMLTALISEKGEVLDVRVLRGNRNFGFDDAAMRAIRQTSFTPAMKSGKRVRTWMPQTIIFKQ